MKRFEKNDKDQHQLSSMAQEALVMMNTSNPGRKQQTTTNRIKWPNLKDVFFLAAGFPFSVQLPLVFIGLLMEKIHFILQDQLKNQNMNMNIRLDYNNSIKNLSYLFFLLLQHLHKHMQQRMMTPIQKMKTNIGRRRSLSGIQPTVAASKLHLCK